MATISEQIADFALGLKYDDIPKEVVDHVKLLMIDTYGCAVPAMKEPHAASVYKAIEKLPNSPEVTLWGKNEKLSLDNAAMYNSCLVHGMDYDDTHGGAIVHPSATVLTAAMSLGELYHKDGKDIITAMVAGYEVILRLGEACKGKLHHAYFHPTGVFAPFAAVVIAARLMNSSKEAVVNALGIATSFASGLTQFGVDGSWGKKLHPGWGIHAGLTSLRFAEEGFTATREAFEGAQSLFMAHIKTTEYLDETFSDFYKRWYSSEIAFKFYPICHMMHSHLDILQRQMKANNFGAEDIKEIKAILSPRAYGVVADPPEMKRDPKTDYHMRFSVNYCLALTAIEKQFAAASVDMAKLKTPGIYELMNKVVAVADESAEVAGHFPGKLEITLNDGRRFVEEQKYETGCPENPATREDVLRKYNANMSGLLSKEVCEKIVSTIDKFEEVKDIESFVSLLKYN